MEFRVGQEVIPTHQAARMKEDLDSTETVDITWYAEASSTLRHRVATPNKNKDFWIFNSSTHKSFGCFVCMVRRGECNLGYIMTGVRSGLMCECESCNFILELEDDCFCMDCVACLCTVCSEAVRRLECFCVCYADALGVDCGCVDHIGRAHCMAGAVRNRLALLLSGTPRLSYHMRGTMQRLHCVWNVMGERHTYVHELPPYVDLDLRSDKLPKCSCSEGIKNCRYCLICRTGKLYALRRRELTV